MSDTRFWILDPSGENNILGFKKDQYPASSNQYPVTRIMARFIYKAKKGPAEIVEGVIEAPNQDAAIDKISEMGCVPIRVTQETQEVSKKAPDAGKVKVSRRLGLFKKIGSKELTVFLEQLSSLVRSKVPLLEAISILYEQTENLFLKEIISHIQNEIREGATLSQSLRSYPRVFPLLYINMIDSGEVGGVLEQTLMRIVELRSKDEEIKNKVLSALAYPVFIVFVGIITVFVLLTFVIPRMAVMFEDMGQVLPLSTRLLIYFSNKVKKYWLYAAAVLAGLGFMLRKRGISRAEKVIIDRFKLKMPLIGNFLKKTILARFARTLGTLLTNGIPLFQAIDITIPIVNNEIFRMELERVRQEIVEGGSLANSMKKSEWFPRFMSNIIAVGEKGGRLTEALSEVAGFYERDIDTATKTMASLIEPVIILVMGLAVGFIVMAMILPIFQMNVG